MSDQERFDEELQLRGIVGFLVGLTLIVVVVLALFWGVSRFVRDDLASRDPEPSPLPEAQVLATPPEPRLQDDPELDWVELREEQDRLLHSYEWVDRDAGRLRVPIDAALEHVADHGLPTWNPPAEDQP